MAKIKRVLHEGLKNFVNYDPDTGEFSWKITSSNGMKAGSKAGSIYQAGYRYIQIQNLDYRAARLAWYFVTGEDPKGFVDHINGQKDDNRFINLRIASNSQNQANRGPSKNGKSGFKGVSWQKARKRWIALIEVDGVKRNLGRFIEKEDAIRAYKAAAVAAWGEFAQVPSEEEIQKVSRNELQLEGSGI